LKLLRLKRRRKKNNSKFEEEFNHLLYQWVHEFQEKLQRDVQAFV